jgi:transcriptional regulator with XRE-family HTH domain
MNKMDGLASNLRTARRRTGMTQAELAEAAGVGSGTVARLELGGEDPRLSTLQKLADALGVELGDLVPLDGHKPDPRPGMHLVALPVLGTLLRVLYECCTISVA